MTFVEYRSDMSWWAMVSYGMYFVSVLEKNDRVAFVSLILVIAMLYAISCCNELFIVTPNWNGLDNDSLRIS